MLFCEQQLPCTFALELIDSVSTMFLALFDRGRRGISSTEDKTVAGQNTVIACTEKDFILLLWSMPLRHASSTH